MIHFKDVLQQRLSEKIKNISSISGGDINDVYKIITDQDTYILKVNRKELFPNMWIYQ